VTEPHVDTALVPYLRDELASDEREHVERHLAACAACRAAAADFQAILERLATTAPPVADPDWVRYRAELRARVGASRRTPRARWLRPLPVGLAAAAAAAIVLTLTLAQQGRGPNGDLASLDDAALATRLDLIDTRPVVERLDLLEDLDVIRDLDRLADTREG
jgi:anti-sigma factor RsiW